MKVVCIGGGPAGLYFSIVLKQLRPTVNIEIFERNPHGSTFGWGVVLSDGTMENLESADRETYEEINSTLAHWDDIEIDFRGACIRSSGHGFCGIGRQRLLDILAARAAALGVKVSYEQEASAEQISDADVVVASDGIFSKTRDKFAEFFQPEIETRRCRYTWLGTKRKFDAFTFIFKETPHGWFQAHCYQFDEHTSTFIVETPEEVWQQSGLESFSKEESIRFCENLFADHLQGAALLSNSSHLRGSAAWINFNRVTTNKWWHKNIVLLGDAAATAHFSIGSGSKLAIESAISLAKNLASGQTLEAAFTSYEAERRPQVLRLQNAARNSTEWFETVKSRAHLDPQQFAYSLLTRSQRISHENLRLRDQSYLEGYERWWASRELRKSATKSIAPMFVPLEIEALRLENRIAVSPMAMYSAADGLPNDFHLVHLGSLALGGAGLVFTEMTTVSPDARITPGCAGLYADEHDSQWSRIVQFVHTFSKAKVALQLGHAGPKGSTCVAWEGMDRPLRSGNWELLAPSAIAYGKDNQVPREMTRAEMKRVLADFVSSTERAKRVGFDWLELHCAHGYLLSSFISPLTNKRTDEYGGTLEKRLRFPLEVATAMRTIWNEGKPFSVRISATDWVKGGTTIEDSIRIAHAFKEVGIDVIDVSAGQVSKAQQPIYGRMFQTPFAERIRMEAHIRTMAVGNIYEADHVNSILAAGRADLALLARPHLADPHWTLRAAAELGYEDQWWPPQYLSAKPQLHSIISRAKEV